MSNDDDFSHKIDRLIQYKGVDPIHTIHEYSFDLKSNHIYLFGEESYVASDMGGSEPGVEYTMANRFIKNLNILMRHNDKPILVHMKTCFPGSTLIETPSGRRRIKDIKVGDFVKTHRNRYKVVTDTMSHRYYGEMVQLGYGRKGPAQQLRATADHPIWVERSGEKLWIPAKAVNIGDVIFTLAKECPDDQRVPWYEDDESGFIKVKVVSKDTYIPDTNGRTVHNITVDEDHSFVANRIVVHNCGGYWEEGMAIYDMIKSCPNQVTILSYTHARSMSSLILQAADKRVVMPNSTFMFHDGTMAYDGTVKQFLNEAEQLKATKKTMLDIYISSMRAKGDLSNKSDRQIKNWLKGQMDRKEEVYLNADDTVKYGFADEVFGANGVYNWSTLTEYD